MAKRFGFFNSINGDRKYLASDITSAFDIGITSGLKADREDNFQIVPHENMTVKMLPGGAMIYGHYLLDEEEELIELDMADGELNRIDRIVLRYDKYERSVKTAVIKGTLALNPTAPAPLRTAEQFDLVLADIRVNAATTEITASNITDMRESDLCGFIGVKGAVSQIDFNTHLAESASKHIKESGNNINGKYIKFDDGTMICTHYMITDLIAISTVVGSMYSSPTIIWTYPTKFEGIRPSISIANNNSGNIAIGAAVTISTDTLDFKMWRPVFDSDTVRHITLMAIGRWK